MSESERPEAPEADHDQDVLDANVEALLRHAQQRSQVPADARARMYARLRDQVVDQVVDQGPARTQPQPGKVRSLLRGKAGVATLTLALAAAVLLAWVLGLGERILSPRSNDSVVHYAHEGLGARAVQLADGSTALLRSGAQIDQLGPRHLRLVGGEVLLDVRTAAEPLLVETMHGNALVLGTSLLLRSDANETLAAVLRGEVTLETPNAPSGSLLRTGEQALLSASGLERIAGRRLSFELAWARELLSRTPEPEGPMRRGNLLARVPRWTGQLQRSAEWPLPVRELTVDVHVEDGHVRTTIDQTFFNHLERDLEGVYQFPLPPDAAISRLAMYVDGQRMEAGVVARDRGREIYEQIVHRRRDPALLEWMQGNLFQVRIFPLPGRTEKRVLLSYTAAMHELYDRGELRVPIPELDMPVGRVNYRIRVVGGAKREFTSEHHAFTTRSEGEDLIAEFSASDHVIGDDIVARVAQASAHGYQRMRHADGRRHVAVRIRPELEASSTAAPARDWIVLFDSSASRGPAELEAQRRFLDGLLAQLDPADRLSLLRFDAAPRWADDALTRIDAIDRSALAATLADERVGLGATDLDAAVDAALARLAEAPAPGDDGRERVPTLLLLGDGLAQTLAPAPTSAPSQTSSVEQLGARIDGRASVVAVSFGPSYDAPTLDRLATIGDGLHLHVEEGDDLGWRALELLSTLATARLHELEATLVDAEGRAIAASTTHASARSLADGELLELLAELGPDQPDPVAVQLRGRPSGRADAQAWTTRIELPEPSEDARWIPRVWAQAHVAALSEDIETNAEAITALGLAHFLVTPTTSLLVLESEQMYRDFDVHRPPADAWAPYAAPDRIEVVREGSSANAGAGQYVVRTPVAMLTEYGRWDTGVRTRGFGPMVPLASADITGWGGLGLVGTGRGGGGFGFGLAGEGSIGLGRTGLIGAGAGSGEFGGRGRRITSGGPKTEASRSDYRGFARREAGPMRWGSNAQQAAVDELDDVAGLGDRRSAHARFASTIVGELLGHDLGGEYASGQPWPSARHVSNDPRLDDLGELVPALFEEPFDIAREDLLLRGLDGSRGSVSDAAAELITNARAAQADVRYALPEGGVLDIDADSHFALTHERWGFLDEHVTYDGEQLRADYPELGLSVVRAVGPTSPALLGAWVPWLVPSAEHLAYFYEVERSGPLTLTLRPIREARDTNGDASTDWLEVELDASFRVIALRMHGGSTVETSEFRWTDAGLDLLVDGRVRSLERRGPAQPITAHAQATEVQLPLPSPSDLAIELERHTPGEPAWIAVQQQRLASLAALGATHEQPAVLEQLLAHTQRLRPGELLLAGASLRNIDERRRAALLDAGEGPIVEYLRASFGRGEGWAKLAAREELRATPVGFAASYRALLREAERAPNEASLRHLQRFLQDYTHPDYAYVATWQLSNRWWRTSERKVQAWLALAEQNNRFKYVALHQAGLARYQYGRNAEASELFERSFREAERDQTLPIVDWSVQWAMTSGRGEAAWQLRWVRLRERVAKSGDASLALRFLAAAQQVGRLDDAQRVIAALDPSSLRPELALALFDTLAAQGRTSEATAVLAALRERPELRDSTAVLLRASMLSEQRGDLDDAALALERAITISLEDTGMSLDDLRAGYSRLFELRARLAQPLAHAASEREAALAQALAVADRWRVEDPDNQEIDRLCAGLLWSLGRSDEAWRQLSSTLDRHAAEGEAVAWVADALEKGGDLERADLVWARAIAVEPTDPIHRLRRAQNLLAVGEDQRARALLDEIITGDWQPRFSFTVRQARDLVTTLEL